MEQKCPVCGAEQNYSLLTRDEIPVFQNIVISEQARATQFKGGKLSLFACEKCGFVYNRDFNAKKIIYDQAYDNCQLHSTYFNNYVDGLVHRIIEDYKIRNSRIIEIGCGQGEFLKRLVENKAYGNCGFGFDPSYRGEDTILDGQLVFQKDYYSEKYANIDADVIVCRHVIEHTSDPVALLRTIRKAVRNKEGVLLFFETPCVNWILDNQVFWDFFYEHCSYFNENSIRTVFSSADFIIQKINHIFERQYLWVEATLSLNGLNDGSNISPSQFSWMEFKEGIDNYVSNENKMVANWRSYISMLHKKKHKIAIWGAGAKGVTFANLIDPNRNIIECVIDINPNKQGNYIPGTGHLITDVETAAQKGITHAILMNPNYISEIQELITQKNIHIQLIEKI